MEWISVEDRIPKKESVEDRIPKKEIVLVYDQNEGIHTAYLSVNFWFCHCECTDGVALYDGSALYNVTHWMPLPSPPKER